MKLTDKQARFVAAYIAGGDKKKAALSAGYSEKSAAVEACRLLKNPRVLAEIERRNNKPAIDGNALDVPPVIPDGKKPLDYMLKVMNDPTADEFRRDKMAVAAAPYMHIKKGEGGKKDEQGAAAKRAAGGKFAPAAPPKLVAAGGKKI